MSTSIHGVFFVFFNCTSVIYIMHDILRYIQSILSSLLKINALLPHSFRRQVVARSYVGCIKNVEIARTNFDLLREAYGVKKGCILKVRSQSELWDAFKVGVSH